MRWAFSVLLALWALVGAADASAVSDCNQEVDFQRKLNGCTALISRGGLSTRNLAIAYYNRGVAHNHLGNIQEAINDYSRAISTDPSIYSAYNNRGHGYIHLGDIPKALQDFNQAIKLQPKNAEYYTNRGGAYVQMGDLTRAIADFDHAIRLDPKHASAYSNRAMCYEEQGNLEAALRDFQSVLASKPSAHLAQIAQKHMASIQKRLGNGAGTSQVPPSALASPSRNSAQNISGHWEQTVHHCTAGIWEDTVHSEVTATGESTFAGTITAGTITGEIRNGVIRDDKITYEIHAVGYLGVPTYEECTFVLTSPSEATGSCDLDIPLMKRTCFMSLKINPVQRSAPAGRTNDSQLPPDPR